MSQRRPDTATTETTLTRDDLPVWLDRVSRTFALTIKMLKEPFRTYASVAYLLCRIVDTVEDCENLPAETKCKYLREFCGRITGGSAPGPDSARRLFPDPATWEEKLTHHESAILALTRSFPDPIQKIVFQYVVEMAEGMVMFLERQNEKGILHFESDEQLDQYCYYVAGTVGLMMNEIFAVISGVDKSGAREAAIELGIGLQLTNIVKDIQKDRLRNIHYCPRGNNPHWPGHAVARTGVDLNWEVLTLASATISHLTTGKDYFLHLDSNFKQYKLFCVTNYLMAWKTLEALLRHSLRADSPVEAKISRFCVYYTLMECHGCVASGQFLNWRVNRLRDRCTSLVLTSDSTRHLPHPARV
jgi:farnesyl-diphosphate farnesyltransferase